MIPSQNWLIILLAAISACAAGTMEPARESPVSVSEAVAQGEMKFGEEALVSGFLSTRSEDLHLYEDSRAYRRSSYDQCLNITFDLDTAYYDEREKYHRKYVVVTGRVAPIDSYFFDTGGCGNLGLVVSDIDLR